jgi:hypothetical protein
MTYRANLALFADYTRDLRRQRKRSGPSAASAGALQALPLSLVGQGRLRAAESCEKMSTMGAFGASFAAGLGDWRCTKGDSPTP